MVILLSIFWPQFLNTILRVGSLPPAIVDNARVLKVGNVTMIKDIILPLIVPDVLKGMRVSLTTGFLMLVYAESFGSRSGIGYFISNANVFANYANIFCRHHRLRHGGDRLELRHGVGSGEIHNMALGLTSK